MLDLKSSGASSPVWLFYVRGRWIDSSVMLLLVASFVVQTRDIFNDASSTCPAVHLPPLSSYVLSYAAFGLSQLQSVFLLYGRPSSVPPAPPSPIPPRLFFALSVFASIVPPIIQAVRQSGAVAAQCTVDRSYTPSLSGLASSGIPGFLFFLVQLNCK